MYTTTPNVKGIVKWCAALDGMRVDRLCKGFDTILTTLEIKLKCQKQAKIQELIDLN